MQRTPLHDGTILSLLRPKRGSKTFRTCFCGGAQQRRHARAYSSAPSSKPQDVGIIGGGVTGLASAWYTLQKYPGAKVTLYELDRFFGGWVQSTRVDVGDGTVLFEQGPRTLRANTDKARETLRMIQELRIEDRIIPTAKDAPAAQNRYLYYPDHLVRMPTTILQALGTWLREPIFKGIPWRVLMESRIPPRPVEIKDESIASFVRRRFGDEMAENFVSAFVHGIYAGNIDELSMRSLFPAQWLLECDYGSIVAGATYKANHDKAREKYQEKKPDPTRLEKMMQKMSVFTFDDGLATLTSSLVKHLQDHPRIELKPMSTVREIEPHRPTGGLELSIDKEKKVHTHIICTTSKRHLDAMVPMALFGDMMQITTSDAPNVMVVNLWYRNPNILPVEGFGYLIPRSVELDQNPERALGVVFDSCSSSAQDTVKGTKLTVMLGGALWPTGSGIPYRNEGLEMAKSLLARHLGIFEEPEAHIVSTQLQCIPQYTVGHEKHKETLQDLLNRNFNRRLTVAGASFEGVSVYDCINSAKNCVDNLHQGQTFEFPTGKW